MTRTFTNLVFIVSTLSGIACVEIDEPVLSVDETGETGETGEFGETGDSEQEPPGAEFSDADSLAPDVCIQLEAVLATAMTEISKCTSDDECMIHSDADRCGCDLAALPYVVGPIVDPLYELLDAAGCVPDCPDLCRNSAVAVCHEGRCETRVNRCPSN